MEKIADIWHKRGVGDGLMFSSVIKEYYCKEYDMVYLDVPALKWLNVKLLGCSYAFIWKYYLVNYLDLVILINRESSASLVALRMTCLLLLPFSLLTSSIYFSLLWLL